MSAPSTAASTAALVLLGMVVAASLTAHDSAAQAVVVAEPADVQAAQANAVVTKVPVETQVADPAAGSPFQSAKEKLSYAMGVEWGAGVKWQHMDVDPEWMARGLRDAFADEHTALLLTPKELATTLKNYAADRQRGMAHALQMMSDKNERAGMQFVAENAKKDGVITLPSGLQYRILKAGKGPHPTIDDNVEIHYRGTLLDGTEFDSTYQRREPATAPVKRMIKGWREALLLMPVGSKWQLFVPPQLAYGERGAGMAIGPNATLLFDMELLSISAQATNDDRTARNELKEVE